MSKKTNQLDWEDFLANYNRVVNRHKKKFGDGGNTENKVEYDNQKEDLPEAVITPTFYQKQYYDNVVPKDYLWGVRTGRINYPTDNTGERYSAFDPTTWTAGVGETERLRDDEIYHRMLNIYNEAAQPVLHYYPNRKDELLGRFVDMRGLDKDRASIYYNITQPGAGDAYNIRNIELMLSELAHPIQAKYGDNNLQGTMLDRVTGEYENLYDNPKSDEYETHEIIEPLLKDYLTFGNSGIIIPEYLRNKKKLGGKLKARKFRDGGNTDNVLDKETANRLMVNDSGVGQQLMQLAVNKMREYASKNNTTEYPIPLFNGGGAGGTFVVEEPQTTPRTFNEAYDNAVARNLETFWFAGKEFNTKKEGNPIRELNNRAVGNVRVENSYQKQTEGTSKNYYPRQAGPVTHPMNLIPLVTDTYSKRRVTPFDRPNGTEIYHLLGIDKPAYLHKFGGHINKFGGGGDTEKKTNEVSDVYRQEVERVFGNNWLKGYQTDPGFYAIADPDAPDNIKIISADSIGYSLDDLKKMQSAPPYAPTAYKIPTTDNWDWKKAGAQYVEASVPFVVQSGLKAGTQAATHKLYTNGYNQYYRTNGAKGLSKMKFANSVAKVAGPVIKKIAAGVGPAIDAYQFLTDKGRGDKEVDAFEGLVGLAGLHWGLPGAVVTGLGLGQFEGSGNADAFRAIGNSSLPEYNDYLRQYESKIGNTPMVYPPVIQKFGGKIHK